MLADTGLHCKPRCRPNYWSFFGIVLLNSQPSGSGLEGYPTKGQSFSFVSLRSMTLLETSNFREIDFATVPSQPRW
jgi:hypothetical protein